MRFNIHEDVEAECVRVDAAVPAFVVLGLVDHTAVERQLQLPMFCSATINNTNVAAYIGGGFTSARSAEIEGIIFSTDTATNPAAALSIARDTLAGVQPYGTTSGL